VSLRTILDQYVQALLDKQVVVQHDETEREREDIVAGADLEKLANGSLHAGDDKRLVSYSMVRVSSCMARPEPHITAQGGGPLAGWSRVHGTGTISRDEIRCVQVRGSWGTSHQALHLVLV